MRRLVARAFVAGLALLVAAGAVSANSSTYAWTMNLRVVDGSKTGEFHGLDKGVLSMSGLIWAYQKSSGANASPLAVHTEVSRDDFIDSKVCSATATPPAKLNVGVSFSTDCGNPTVQAGTYYLFIWKGADDGWDEHEMGTLKTR